MLGLRHAWPRLLLEAFSIDEVALTVSMQSYITFTGTVPLMAHMHIVITSHLPKYPVVPASAGKPVCMSQGNLQHL